MRPERLQTGIRSAAIRILASEALLRSSRSRARLRRRLSGGEQAVHYFHRVDDPYSHLVVQKLDALREAYDIPFRIHLVSKPADSFLGSSEHFDTWALRDAQSIAHDYGTVLNASCTPQSASVQTANDTLAPLLDAPASPKPPLPPARRCGREGSSPRTVLGKAWKRYAQAMRCGTSWDTTRAGCSISMASVLGIDRIRLLKHAWSRRASARVGPACRNPHQSIPRGSMPNMSCWNIFRRCAARIPRLATGAF